MVTPQLRASAPFQPPSPLYTKLHFYILYVCIQINVVALRKRDFLP